MKDLIMQKKIKRRCVISDNGCWLWQGAKNQDGYGLMPSLVSTLKNSMFYIDVIILHV